MKPSRQLKLGIAWFRPEQLSRLLEISEDREDLEETFAEWESLAEEKLRHLRAQGVKAEKVTIDVEELLVWWQKHGFICQCQRQIALRCRTAQEARPSQPDVKRVLAKSGEVFGSS